MARRLYVIESRGKYKLHFTWQPRPEPSGGEFRMEGYETLCGTNVGSGVWDAATGTHVPRPLPRPVASLATWDKVCPTCVKAAGRLPNRGV